MLTEQKLTLENKLKEISEVVQIKYKNEKNLGVLSGISGLALFQFYYSKYLDTDKNADLGIEMISTCIDRINAGFSYPTYCDGIAGLGWTIQHLIAEDFIDLNSDELLEPFDGFLFTQMKADLHMGKYDFLHGALGYGFYFFKRYKHTKNTVLKTKYKDYLNMLLSSLEGISISDGNFVRWESLFDHEKGTKVSNLSLSHGMASIINFLARLYEFNIGDKTTKKLLAGSVEFILNYRSTQHSFSKFPDIIEENRPVKYKSRLAWCYGDLGIGISLLRAGNVLNDEGIKSKSLEVLKYNTCRRDDLDTKVRDAGFCHGSFGNAQIFRNISYTFPYKEFKDASHYWITDGINRGKFKNGYAGYKLWHGASNSWKSSISLLEGISGIGLCIIDSLSKGNNNWDEALMLS